jgi:hypothetical protein
MPSASPVKQDGQDPGARDVHLDVGKELYLEEGELGDPFNPLQTQEKKAGF